MAVNELLFKDLPFRPDCNQVFYIENGYDTDANNFVRNNYVELKSMFAHNGMDFYYLPYLLREHDIEAKVRYYAPYLSQKILVTEVRSNAFVPYIADDDTRENLKPSLVFGGMKVGYDGVTKFLQVLRSRAQSVELAASSFGSRMKEDDACVDPVSSPSAEPSDYIEPHEEKTSTRRNHKASSGKAGILRRVLRRFGLDDDKYLDVSGGSEAAQKTEEEIDEEQSLVETEKVLRELRRTVQKLRLEGVSLMAIHEFIDKNEPLSRMVISPDYRIFLPDYNGMEIEMGALPKAIYFLYLRYPEGIVYKHMQDYYTELLNIYKQLRPNTDEARLNLTITKVVNPLGNALNENIARIRKAFVEKFDEHLANNYIIKGERGAQYYIPLDRDLILWEE